MVPEYRNYIKNFELADGYISHANEVAESIGDEVKHRYIGFIVTIVVTTYELAIKDIFIESSYRKHKEFGIYIENSFDKMNGRISLKDIKNNRIPLFGESYKNNFETNLEAKTEKFLKKGEGNIKSSYGNIITWRNQFVHQGGCAHNATYSEAINSYQLGKHVIHTLNETFFE